VRVVHTGGARATRPSGRRFGELVHACLALVPLAAGEAEVQGVVDVVGRSLGATEAEASAASAAVLAALSHPRLEAARRASEVRREATIIEHLADGTVVEGAVDLAYLGPDGWVVVEFKTDVELDGSLGAYAAQTSAYVRAIAAATGRPARGVILRV
jgi:ATP-dependent exoDNAse (exonuclease V) beta subunit